MSGGYIGIGAFFAIFWSITLTRSVYLDHAATTSMHPEVREVMAKALADWANPSSPHAPGRSARALLEDARERIQQALGWEDEVVFTSGATEALDIAVTRARAGDRHMSAVEHDAVRRACPDAHIMAVDSLGQVQVNEDIKSGDLVVVQSVNNETGVIQTFSKPDGVIWLADCAQSATKLDLPDADMIALSAHKFGGPPGIGALLVRDFALLEARGGQEQGYRGGTENLPAILGMAKAVELRSDWISRAAFLRNHLDQAIELAGGEIVARDGQRLPTIASYRMPGVAATSQLIQLDMAGIAVSAGSACSSGSLKPGHVLPAMGWSETASREVIRVSFGPETSLEDIESFLQCWSGIVRRAASRPA